MLTAGCASDRLFTVDDLERREDWGFGMGDDSVSVNSMSVTAGTMPRARFKG